ncbi:ABC transporter ATP-binding protein [Lysobacter sp. HA35]
MCSDIVSSGEREVAIQIDDVSKAFQVYRQPQDRLKQSVMPRLRRLMSKAPKRYFDEFWALRNVGFEVRRGDALAIIGRNGSGKSTLLQIICGTLSPTSGSVSINGRVAALLELGAGFNPEFTGRENIYMSASILGLTREQIESAYDDIVAFADIGSEFIEQPVKVYSSGMYVRLAFAVIAHVDADILIIDEALAVGDAVFVQKCMRFLRKFRERGTLLFVSHDTGSVINFCRSAVWLHQGIIRESGNAEDVCNAYLEHCAQEIYGENIRLQTLQPAAVGAAMVPSQPVVREPETELTLFSNIHNSTGWTSNAARIDRVELLSCEGDASGVFHGGESVRLVISATALQPLTSAIIGFFVKDRLGQSLFGEHTFTYVPQPYPVAAGDALEAAFTFTLPLLPDGEYSMTVSIAEGDPWDNVQHHWLHDAVLIRVASRKLRYGLVGIPFHSVSLRTLPDRGAR